MIIDLHIHSKTCSDGKLAIPEILNEAKIRKIGLMSITDHDSIDCQKQAIILARKNQIHYVSGIELNITISHKNYRKSNPISLDLLGYNFDINNKPIKEKLSKIVEHRKDRTRKIFQKLNTELRNEKIELLTKKDLIAIQKSTDGVLGRPHIADYLIKKRIVRTRKEAFNKYLVKCNTPKYPLCLEEGSNLIRNAGGVVVLAHPNDPFGTSLVRFSNSLHEQTKIIQELMLDYIDGIECWHSRNDEQTTEHYVNFSKDHNLIMTGGSDCHQKPIIMGSIDVPNFVSKQFIK
ncbi:PHP domain-containing protein [Candidatus Bathyarchaeota archaeon]|nr:PHP domain-containing protein [Candidatus Bathyarchaeota archaeon]